MQGTWINTEIREAFITSGYEQYRSIWGKGLRILAVDLEMGIWVDNPDNPEDPIYLDDWWGWQDGVPFHFGSTQSIFLDAQGNHVQIYPPDIPLWRERGTGVPITAYTHVRRKWPHFDVAYPDLVFDKEGHLLYNSGRLIEHNGGLWWYTTQFGGPEGYEDIPLHQIWPAPAVEVRSS